MWTVHGLGNFCDKEFLMAQGVSFWHVYEVFNYMAVEKN